MRLYKKLVSPLTANAIIIHFAATAPRVRKQQHNALLLDNRFDSSEWRGAVQEELQVNLGFPLLDNQA